MVDIQALHLPLPQPHNNSEVDLTGWRGQEWGHIREQFEDSQRRHLPYPSPQSLPPRERQQSMTVNGGPTQSAAYASTVEYSKHDAIVSSKPASPVFQQTSQAGAGGHSIVSYLQLPSTITTSQGSLSEFAAQLTCLFWFESSATVAKIENDNPSHAMTFIPEAYPATGFMKWVTTILSTTQVTQNVILLALLFIYRLKKQCPTVKGKLGSEYRLLTVALMLGNKFLDDNTYTNKTWAEVSGISVHEIHVMEVEFLSHMKYDLYTSKEQWDRWHHRLSKFWTCFNQTVRKQKPLPSPPASTHASPPYIPSMSPSTTVFTSVPYLDYPQSNNGRKRSFDGDSVEPPAKRQSHAYQHLPTLPIPNVPSPSTQQQQTYSNTRALMAFQPAGKGTPPHLPPVNWLAGISTAATPERQTRQHTPSTTTTGMVRTPSNGSYSTTSTIPSGYVSTPSTIAAHYNSSSTQSTNPGPTYPSSAAHTLAPNQLSPSHFLTSRSSPYRPVRNMSTLLVPPPSNAMPQHTAQISQDQMRWQPLGKTLDDQRSGRVPYLHREAWPQTHQFDQWPGL